MTTTQGSVGFHQLHFLVQSQDHFEANGSLPVSMIQGQCVRLRIDFRGPDIGDFVYHGHILNHEDQGMMAIIRVRPPE